MTELTSSFFMPRALCLIFCLGGCFTRAGYEEPATECDGVSPCTPEQVCQLGICVPTECDETSVPPTSVHFRSVGPGNSAALTANTGAAFILDSTLNLEFPAPNHVGVGDVFLYDSDGDGNVNAIAFLHHRCNAQRFVLSDTTGASLGDSPIFGTWSLYRAYTSLNDAVSGVENSGLPSSLSDFDPWTDGQDLTQLNADWYIALYGDGLDSDNVVVSRTWVTSETNVLRMIVPREKSHVGVSQRHRGFWDTNAYHLSVPSGHALRTFTKHVAIKGLQIQVESIDIENGHALFLTPDGTGTADISGNLLVGSGASPNMNNHRGIQIHLASITSTFRIWNNIIREWGRNNGSAQCIFFSSGTGSSGQPLRGGRVFVYNNTCYRSRLFVFSEWDFPTIGKNNLSIDVPDAFFSGCDPQSATNLSSDSTITGCDTKLSSADPSQYFVSDQELRPTLSTPLGSDIIGRGTNLSTDVDLMFADDATGAPRPLGNWTVGALEP